MEFLTKLFDSPESIEKNVKFLKQFLEYIPELLSLLDEYAKSHEKKYADSEIIFQGALVKRENKMVPIIYIMEIRQVEATIKGSDKPEKITMIVQMFERLEVADILKTVNQYIPNVDLSNELNKIS